MDLVGTKVLVLVLLGLIKLGSGLLPVLLDKVLQVKKVSECKIIFCCMHDSLNFAAAIYCRHALISFFESFFFVEAFDQIVEDLIRRACLFNVSSFR